MTLTTCETDGFAPFGAGVRAPIQRWRGEIIAGLQVLAVAGVAAALLMSVHRGAPPAPDAATYRSALAGPIQLAAPAPTLAAPDSKRLLQDLLTRAGLRPNFELRRLNESQARRVNALMPATLTLDAAKPFILPINTKDGREALHCLTQAAYFEAGATGPDAQGAVVQVVLNRVRHPDFPKSVCGVVYQGAGRESGCQFSFTCDGSLDRPVDAAAWEAARKVAARALTGSVAPRVGAATYYHADYVVPAWAPSLVKTATVGPHIFYRMSGGLGLAAALNGRYAGGELKVSKTPFKAIEVKAASAEKVERVAVMDGRVHLQLAAPPEIKPVVAPAAPALPSPAT